MTKIEEYRSWASACVARMDEIVKTADAEKRELSSDEEAEFNRLDGSVNEARKSVDRLVTLENLNRDLNRPAPVGFPGVIVKPSEEDKEFKSLGEFMYLLRFDANNRKIAEYREQTMSVGSEGGLMVPAQFKPEILKVDAMGALFRPRARVLPAGDPPDAEITMPVLDQSGNMYGGIQMYSFAEGAATTESSASLKDISLKPYAQGGHVVITDKLLRNWSAASGFITDLMRGAMIYYEDSLFLSGNGVAKPTGFLNHPATIAVARASANAISFADVTNMYARTLMRGGNYAWITSQTTIPQLVNIRDTANNNLWLSSAVTGMPPTLYGIPVLFHDRVPGLGSKGDLMLVNFNYYLIKDGSGLFIRVSDQVYFLNGKTVFQLQWNIDGKPIISAPIALEGSTSDTVSPFVVLGA